MDWIKKIWELVQSRKFGGAVFAELVAWQTYESVPKTPETTAAFIVATVGIIGTWVHTQGKVDVAKIAGNGTANGGS